MTDNVIPLKISEMAGVEIEMSRLSTDTDGNYVLKLTKPIQDGKDEITQLTFHRPVVGDLAAMDDAKGDTAKSICLLARICRLTPKLVRDLDGYDFMQAQGIVSSFLTRPR